MELVQAIDTILAAKMELETAWDGNPLPSFVLTADLRVQRCNKAACLLFGREYPQLLGADIVSLLWKDEVTEEIRSTLLRSTNLSSFPVILAKIPGSFQILSKPIPEDRRVLFLLNLETIPLSQNREEEARLKLALESGQSGVWDFSLRQGKAYFSPEYARILGFEPDQFPQNFTHWETLVHWEDRERVRSLFENYLNGSIDSHDMEIKMFSRTGKSIWIWSRGKVVERDENDLPIRVVGTHLDITERKKTEIRTEAVLVLGQKQSEETVDSLLRIALEYMIQLTSSEWATIRMASTNGNIQELGVKIKRSQSQVSYLPFSITDTEMKKMQTLEVNFERKEQYGFTVIVGQKRAEYEETDSKEIQLLGTELLNILLRKRTEELLLASEWNLQSIVECSSNGILILQEGKIIFFNRSAEILLAQSKADLQTKSISDVLGFLSGEDPAEFMNQLSNNKTSPDQNNIEKYTLLVNGQKKWFSLWAIEIIFNGNVAILVNITDVTRTKETEKQLLQSEKLATIGQLAAGVAHEINNPMAFISSNLEMMKRNQKDLIGFIETIKTTLSSFQDIPQIQNLLHKFNSSDINEILNDTEEMLDESIDGAGRVVEIVKNIKSFAHVDKEESFVACNLNEIIQQAMNLSHHNIKYDCVVELKLNEKLPKIECRPQEIGQVLINLLVNAGHAIEEKKKLGLFPETQSEKPGKIEIYTDLITSEQGEALVRLRVKDNGIGIPKEIQTRIFDPFFSTKETGEGTGLGLSISMDIIRKHKGNIQVESVRCEGTTFEVILPIKEG